MFRNGSNIHLNLRNTQEQELGNQQQRHFLNPTVPTEKVQDNLYYYREWAKSYYDRGNKLLSPPWHSSQMSWKAVETSSDVTTAKTCRAKILWCAPEPVCTGACVCVCICLVHQVPHPFWGAMLSYLSSNVSIIFSCDQAAIWLVQSVRLSVCPPVCPSITPFSLCYHHHIIIKFSGVITMDRSDVHAKGQGQKSKVKVTEVKTQLSLFRTVTPVWIQIWQWNNAHSLKWPRRGALLFFKVICQISRLSHGSKKLTQTGRFRTVTPVWIHRWLRNDTQSLK